MTVLLSGFIGITSAAQLAASVRGTSAPVTAATTATGGLSVTVTLPASETGGVPFAPENLRVAVEADETLFAYAQVRRRVKARARIWPWLSCISSVRAGEPAGGRRSRCHPLRLCPGTDAHLPESQGQHLALTVLFVPYSLYIGM